MYPFILTHLAIPTDCILWATLEGDIPTTATMGNTCDNPSSQLLN